jgi:transcription antitermination factor NusA-like protein
MIDIVVWDADKATFIANAMKPANVARVKIDEA